MGDNNNCFRLTDNINDTISFCENQNNEYKGIEEDASGPITSFELAPDPEQPYTKNEFFGVSLENQDSAGILYHTIGVNGARYDQYLKSEGFWAQLGVLHADLYIVSLGTNEAQNPTANVEGLMAIIDSFTGRLKEISPRAAILLTTPVCSFYKMKKPNTAIFRVTTAILNEAELKELPSWDLYKIAGGKDAAMTWKKAGLFSHDLVHFTGQGYELQGSLLLHALSKSYDTYAKKHPFKQVKNQKTKK